MESARCAIVREVIGQRDLGVAMGHHARDFEDETPETPLGLGALRFGFFPELAVEIDELVDLPGDRVLGRLTVRASPAAGAATWPAVVIFRFEGDKIVARWSVHDPLPWMQAVGAVDDDETLGKRLNDARVPPPA